MGDVFVHGFLKGLRTTVNSQQTKSHRIFNADVFFHPEATVDGRLLTSLKLLCSAEPASCLCSRLNATLSVDNSKELLTNLLVCGSVEEVVEFCGVSKFHLDDPVLVCILVDELGLTFECAVDFEDGTADG